MAETSFLIKDVRVFTGSETIENGYVHISFGKIASLGKALPPPPHNNIPPNTKTFSKPGHTLIPGLIDAHNHATNADPQALRQALRFGVTTFMDMHNEIANVEKLRRQAEQERDRAADFKTAGLCATIEDGWPIPFVTAFDSSAEVCRCLLCPFSG
jgi:imidazolonepropionase-like amidohydrolase